MTGAVSRQIVRTTTSTLGDVEPTTVPNQVVIGTKLIDTSLIPYIRPQTIHVYCRGLKPNTHHYVFFDGEDLSDFVTPYTPDVSVVAPAIYSSIQDDEGVANPQSENFLGMSALGAGVEGDTLVANAIGEVFFFLRLPDDPRFFVGSKEVKVTDSPTNNDEDATSTAKKYFHAHGVVNQKQNETLTVDPPPPTPRPPSDPSPLPYTIDFNINGSSDAAAGHGDGCMGYGFKVNAPADQEGAFLTSVDIYIASKSATKGAWFEVVELDAGGQITKNQIPGSEVWYTSDELVTSNDASLPHNIEFKYPIFLYNNKQYALLIHPEGLNPDLYIWVSRIGETDIITGNKVTDRAYTGTLFNSNNGWSWDQIPQVDLKCTFYRAKFSTGVNGTVTVGNKPVEKILLGNTSGTLTNYGETFITDDTLTLSGITGGTIVVGNTLRGNTSNGNTTVSGINGSDYTMANTGFSQGELVTEYYTANMVATGVTATVSLVAHGSAQLVKYTSVDGVETGHFIGSNGAFEVGKTIHGQISGKTATVDENLDYRFTTTDFEPVYLNFANTTISYQMQSLANTGSKGSYFNISENHNYVFDDEQSVYSRTNEIANLSGTVSNNVKITLSTSSDWVTPVVNLKRTHGVFVDNIVNANTVGETEKSGGGLINKYISRTVTLADGQDAEDLQVILTMYRPPGTDIHVYVKLLNGEDSQTIADKSWLELEYYDDTVYSSLADKTDFKEYSFHIPVANMTGPNGEFQYTTDDGGTFTSFKYYTIKIGLEANNSAIIPQVADLRAIALQL